jgi:threonine dehydratase
MSLRPTYDEVVAAAARISDGIVRTPCSHSPILSQMFGCEVYTKMEYLQETGSFKERGARNALLLLSEDQKKKGVIAASAGNHALALAYHGKLLGIPVRVVMPTIAPLVKQERARQFGAEVELFGANIAEAKTRADEYVDRDGMTYVHGFDGIDVIAGAGSMGLEILEQMAVTPDAIVLPVGGGGLIAGLALAVKTKAPGVKVIGVEPEQCASYLAAVAKGEPVLIEMGDSLGDGLAVPRVGDNAFALARQHVDKVVTVSEQEIALAILRVLEVEKGVVEGAGAAGLAALVGDKLPELRGKTVVIVLCGGNIDPAVLGRVINYGLRCDWRLVRFRTVISDRPGGLEKFTKAIAEKKASVKQISHERTFGQPNFSKVTISCIVETKDKTHASELIAHLEESGMPCDLF